MENNRHVLLSICIPTYNRSKALDGNLKALFKQIENKNLPIELIVSDNCSSDDTSVVVKKHIDKGMSINYIRNSENLGMDGNFAQCYRKAIGKYVLVLGDDDFLIEGMLEKLLEYLKNGDYGLVHLKTYSNNQILSEIFLDSNLFLENISYWITYITSNIVNSKYIKDYDFEKYFGTYLTIVPLYLTAAIESKENIIIEERIFSDGMDSKTNGGYNFFEVFLVNYLKIWKEFEQKGKIKSSLFRRIKRDILRRFLIPNAYILLVEKKKNNYKLENSVSNILKYYFKHPYFYFDSLAFFMKHNLKKIL
ncbi:MAG: glycosyltransferase family 2 protein [Flavobacterium sp.]